MLTCWLSDTSNKNMEKGESGNLGIAGAGICLIRITWLALWIQTQAWSSFLSHNLLHSCRVKSTESEFTYSKALFSEGENRSQGFPAVLVAIPIAVAATVVCRSSSARSRNHAAEILQVPSIVRRKPMQKPWPLLEWHNRGRVMAPSCCLPHLLHLKGKSFLLPKTVLLSTRGLW